MVTNRATDRQPPAPGFDPGCARCNIARHNCPGCGIDVDHSVVACDVCTPVECVSCDEGRHYADTGMHCYCCGREVR